MSYLQQAFNALSCCRSTSCRVVLLGLDGAGKTTLLYRLKLGSAPVSTTPTVGFNVETIRYKRVTFTLLDIGGQSTLRVRWSGYIQQQHIDAVIFVVDATDRTRTSEVAQALKQVFELEELRGNAKLLVCVNKKRIDDRQPECMAVEEVLELLDLDSVAANAHHVGEIDAVSGDGVYDALNWLVQVLADSNEGQ